MTETGTPAALSDAVEHNRRALVDEALTQAEALLDPAQTEAAARHAAETLARTAAYLGIGLDTAGPDEGTRLALVLDENPMTPGDRETLLAPGPVSLEVTDGNHAIHYGTWSDDAGTVAVLTDLSVQIRHAQPETAFDVTAQFEALISRIAQDLAALR